MFKKKKEQLDTHSRYLVPFVKPCWFCDSAAHARGCAASRLKDGGNIFVTECKSYSEGGTEWTSYEGRRFISSEWKQKKKKKRGEKLIKSIFLKLKCKYPHLQELECWSYLLSRHGILLYVIYMQFIILWLSLFCICVCYNKWLFLASKHIECA